VTDDELTACANDVLSSRSANPAADAVVLAKGILALLEQRAVDHAGAILALAVAEEHARALLEDTRLTRTATAVQFRLAEALEKELKKLRLKLDGVAE
jgi:hypothetical protein